ncbi:MAG: hypothetical protein LUQ50_10660 [Methanospirillum sp.]|uniref:hypothetical protein n=1 Tax=Methanospirillum sp. TaxID=45200 RepID=UPI00236E7BD1|nr:hypothetical protein [Methanospirillum sp.]MDD1729516.1 hypothetical protein [Methanospirillum sp.]
MIHQITKISVSTDRTRVTKTLQRTVLMTIIVLCILPTCVASLPIVMYPLKPSPAIGPYQDSEFLEISNETILGLSNQTIPNGTALRELQTTQQKLANMNISPELYPTAKQINAYLYYSAKAGDESSDAMSLADKPYSPEYTDWTVNLQAKIYQNASKTIWKQIQDLYPNVTSYTLRPTATPDPSEKMITRWPKSPFSTFDNEDSDAVLVGQIISQT